MTRYLQGKVWWEAGSERETELVGQSNGVLIASTSYCKAHYTWHVHVGEHSKLAIVQYRECVNAWCVCVCVPEELEPSDTRSSLVNMITTSTADVRATPPMRARSVTKTINQRARSTSKTKDCWLSSFFIAFSVVSVGGCWLSSDFNSPYIRTHLIVIRSTIKGMIVLPERHWSKRGWVWLVYHMTSLLREHTASNLQHPALQIQFEMI